VSFVPATPSLRIVIAIGFSMMLHGLALWGSDIRMPQTAPLLPPLAAKLEALPAAPAQPRPPSKARPAAPEPVPEPTPAAAEPPQDVPPTETPPDAAVETETETETEIPAAKSATAAERPPLPRQARLAFAIHLGDGGLRVGEAVHTLEIKDGRYVLQATTRTVGLARLFKSYQLTQYSNGSYGRRGLQPELFLDERKDSLGTRQNAVEFDREARLARFPSGREVALPPETQDILSVMYQFPPLARTEIASVSVGNGKKIEHYDFEITANEEIETALGKLLTVRLHKMHAPHEEGLDIWLAREYRLFPVKIRYTEKNGEVAAEAVITDIRVSEEQGERSNAVN
jgi:hypothetical protein